jgi:hypothetical protein
LPDRSPGDPDFGAALTTLLRAAGLTPDGVRAELRDRRGLVSRSTLYDWMKNEHLPEDDGPLMEIVVVCLAAAKRRGVPVAPAPKDVRGWRRLLADAKQARDARVALVGRLAEPRPGSVRPGMPIRRWHPVALGVHRAIGGDALPGYVRRKHDDLLREVIDPAVIRSRVVVLRGGSSTGKTRAAYEAVLDCLPDWLVDSPRTAAILAARLRDGFAPRTVVWLDELSHFVTPDTQVLAELNDVLTRTSRVVVIATLWPTQWGAYTRYEPPPPGKTDSFLGLSPLLKWLPELSKTTREFDPALGGVIDVPDRFTAPDVLRAWRQRDRAVASAIVAAKAAGSPGMVAQYLAGVPDLEEHYMGSGADPYGQAVITAAMDTARFGHHGPYPAALLRQAVVGYLDDSLRTVEQDRWWQPSLGYATRVLKGAVAPLMPVPPASGTGVEGYRLADYLDQLGSRMRQTLLGPISLWEALAAHTSQSEDLSSLAESAYYRGLYRYAAILWKKAILAGGINAVKHLLELLARVDPQGVRLAAQWAASNVSVDNPDTIIEVLKVLRESRQRKAVSVLATRAAEQVALSDADALARFLGGLDRASQRGAITTTAARIANSAGTMPISSKLVRQLNAVGKQDTVAALVLRFASRADLSHPQSIALALRVARECGAQEGQIRETLLNRHPADSVTLHNLRAVAELVRALHEADARQAATVLAHRAADQAALDAPGDVVVLLRTLKEAGQHEAVERLLARHPVEKVALDNVRPITSLFELLREIGEPHTAAALARRFATAAPLDKSWGLHYLFESLITAGEKESASMLARRAVSQRALRRLTIDIRYTWEAVELLGKFYAAGEKQAALALASQILEEKGPVGTWWISGLDDLLAVARRIQYMYGDAVAQAVTASLASHQSIEGPFDNPRLIANRIKWLDRAVATDAIKVLLSQRPEGQVALENADSVGQLLGALRHLRRSRTVRVDTSDTVRTLLARQPEKHARTDDPLGLARLLVELYLTGASGAVAALIERITDQVKMPDARGAARLLNALHQVGAKEALAKLARQAADEASLASPDSAAGLLKVLAKAGMPEVAAAVAMRAAEQATLDRGPDVGQLLTALNQPGTRQAFITLANRAADAGHFERLVRFGLADKFTFGREPDGAASRSWGWADL